MDETQRRTVKVEKKVLSSNDRQAEKNRLWLEERGIRCYNLISSPGAGKTTLLEKTLEALAGRLKCAVIVGDLQTDNDAKRLSGKGAQVRQIETISACHLDAFQINRAIPEVVQPDTQLLFIENVGNLVCPAAYDLGEDGKIVLLSVPEGEDKPEKYPVVFSIAKAVVITKTDLSPHIAWNHERCISSIRAVAPSARLLELSARTGEGFEAWIDFLIEVPS